MNDDISIDLIPERRVSDVEVSVQELREILDTEAALQRRVDAQRARMNMADLQDELDNPRRRDTPVSSTARRRRRRSDSHSSEERGKKRRHIRMRDLPTYTGKSLREFKEWTQLAESVFELHASEFETDKERILFARMYLGGTPNTSWTNRVQSLDLNNTSWEFFKNFLHNLVEDPVNRRSNAGQKYHDAAQRPNQSAQEFANYLETLEAELSPYSESHQITHFLVRLRPELRHAITYCNAIPTTRAEMVGLAVRMENTLKRGGAPDSFTQRNQGAKKKGNNPRSRASTTGTLESRITAPSASTSKVEPGASSSYDKRKVTCWNCNKKGHYANECIKPKKENPNKEPVGQSGNERRSS